MIIRKAFKYRLKTSRQIESKLSQFAGCCRFVWNKALAMQKERLEQKQSCLPYTKMAAQLRQWKEQEETNFLKDCHSQPLQQTLMSLDKAIKEAFDKKNPKRFPRFKKKALVRDSFRFPQGFKLEDNKAFLPKLGWVRFFKSRQIQGEPKNVTVSRRGGCWFVSIQTEQTIADPVHPSSSVVGIDMGIKRFASLSDGSYLEPLHSFKKLESKLAKEQRKLARKVKFSSNWLKQKKKISRLHIRIADARNDYLHKNSTVISKNHAIIVLEDLRIKNMSASAKGTVDDPGKNVKAKAGLNKAILDQGWYEFRRQLEYKQLWRGGQVIAVNPQNTSRECPACGHTEKGNRKNQACFVCLNCGFEKNADHTAAINILAAGHAAAACGEMASAAQ